MKLTEGALTYAEVNVIDFNFNFVSLSIWPWNKYRTTVCAVQLFAPPQKKLDAFFVSDNSS